MRSSTTEGRHRAPRPRRPWVLVVAVALLLSSLGAGAALLGPFTGTSTSTSQDRTTADGAGAGEPQVSSSSPTPTTSATPSPRVTSASPTVSPKRTTATAGQTPSRKATRTTHGGTEAEQVLALVNRERAKKGCRAVTLNSRLTSAAQGHSEDQAEHNTMSHTGSDGSSPWDRAERAGYSNAIGENVAAGFRTAEAVMDGWMNSPGHRANILNCDARAMGLGVASASDGTRYWTQMFGSVA